MKKIYSQIIIAIVVLNLIGCSGAKSQENKSIIKGLIDEQECSIDSDCVQIETTCCPCSNGGKQECVSDSKAKEYEEKLKNCPENPRCLSVYNCKMTGCICKGNKCVNE